MLHKIRWEFWWELVGRRKIKDKVFKRKTGKSKDKWIVRIEYLDELTGKTKYIERLAEKKGEATDLRNKLVDDIKKIHGQMQTGERMIRREVYCYPLRQTD